MPSLMMPTLQPPVTIPRTGDSMNVTLLFALTLCSALPPKRHMNIIFRHATQALPRALWRVFFLHTQICGKNIALRGVFLIDKLPPRSKIDINMYKVHKFLSTT